MTRHLSISSSVLLIAAALLSATPALARPRVSFGSKRISPKTARSGGQVVASLRVAARGGASVSSVRLRLVRTGVAPTVVAMTAAGNGSWSQRVTLPVNFSGRSVLVHVWADAQTSLGLKSTKLGIVKLQSTTVDPNLPPPPPPI